MSATHRMPQVTVLGGGQLAQMMIQAGYSLGQTVRVLAASDQDPAARTTPAVTLGEHTDIAAVRRAAAGADVVTFDHEHVPTELLQKLTGEGVNFQPRPEALIYAQDKLVMRERLSALGMPVPQYADLAEGAEVLAGFWSERDGAVILKATRGGYDGKGVWAPETLEQAQAILAEQQAAGVRLLAERKVAWTRELSAMVAVSPEGQGAVWPVVESVQRDGICALALAPAPGLAVELRDAAQKLALDIARELGVTGVMAVELFEEVDSKGRAAILINELAMRPHNTGHWTQDGCVTSQFEQHLRAVLDYPLGATEPIAPITVMANVIGAAVEPRMTVDERLHHLFARFPEVSVHLYGKAERPGRKLGHINLVGAPGGSVEDVEYVADVRRRAELAAGWLASGRWEDGWDPHRGPRD